MIRFEKYHPLILFIYFFSVIFISFFSMNPVVLLISYFSAIIFCIVLYGLKEIILSLLVSVPIMALIALTNPIFVHKGETVLFFLNGNPVTKEALYFGIFFAVMIMSVIYWFKAYHKVMSSDKYIYLFGKTIPKLSLLISMILSFIPKFKRAYKEADEAQKALGIYTSKSYVDRIRSKFRVMSILITWSLENSIDTSDSMKARGYELKGRTSYSIYKWNLSDTILFSILIVIFSFVLYVLLSGQAEFVFYPVMDKIPRGNLLIITYVLLFLLMMMATFIEIKEKILWHYLKSKI